MLIDDGADVIIADDGLQHYRLERDYEICVIDGARGLGNGMLLPAGPLRESTARLSEVDRVLVNGAGAGLANSPALEEAPLQFDLAAVEASRLDGSLKRALDNFAGTTVHAVAAIGNPDRFFEMLQSHGIQVIEHPFRDHAALSMHDLEFGDDFDVLMTEKDAVKIDASASDKFWSVPVELTADPAITGPWLEQIECRIRSSVENR
jgi:tetraacyldisaccharide 4'-kinase